MSSPHAAMSSIMASRLSASALEQRLARACSRVAYHKHPFCSDVANLFEDCHYTTQAGSTQVGRGRVVVGQGAAVDQLVAGRASQYDCEQLRGLLFVCFCGQLRGEDPRRDERWDSDEKMCAELGTMHPGIIYYVSIPFDPLIPDGEWYNLVLFDDVRFLDAFERSETHRYAREVLSGDSFRDVCVRRGRIGIGAIGGAATGRAHDGVAGGARDRAACEAAGEAAGRAAGRAADGATSASGQRCTSGEGQQDITLDVEYSVMIRYSAERNDDGKWSIDRQQIPGRAAAKGKASL